MVLIDLIKARQILNSRGEPTIEVEITLNNGATTRASVPSGKSKSSYEALELLDKDFSNYFGRSVNHAVENINNVISPRLKKQSTEAQFKIDQILLELDGTPNKAHMGSNATLAVSMVIARAAALTNKVPLYKHLNELFLKAEVQDRYGDPVSLPENLNQPTLPIPAFNLINGGQHADSNIPIQEFLVLPVGLKKAKDQVKAAAEIYWNLKLIFQKEGRSTNIGDEGGFAPNLEDSIQALEYLEEAVRKAGYHTQSRVLYGLDVAGAELPDNFYSELMSNHPMITVEDPFPQDDWERFTEFNKAYPDLFVVSDDLTAMQLERLYLCIEKKAANAVIIKPNQIGTITETLQFAKVAKHAGIDLFASHRSGETNDDFIVDLAIGIGAKFLKSGAPVRGERVAKYNHLMELSPPFEQA